MLIILKKHIFFTIFLTFRLQYIEATYSPKRVVRLTKGVRTKGETKKMKKITIEVLEQLMTVLGQHEKGETVRHLEHTSEVMKAFTTRLVKKKVLTEREAVLLTSYSRYHDIGKSRLNPEILFSPTLLDRNGYEFAHIKTHTLHGGNLLIETLVGVDVDGYDILRDVVVLHHENHNGTGYPFGFKGNQEITEDMTTEEFLTAMKSSQISIYAAIMKIVDVLASLDENRVWRQSLPYEKIVEIMNGGNGTEHNPFLLKEAMMMFQEMKENEETPVNQ